MHKNNTDMALVLVVVVGGAFILGSCQTHNLRDAEKGFANSNVIQINKNWNCTSRIVRER